MSSWTPEPWKSSTRQWMNCRSGPGSGFTNVLTAPYQCNPPHCPVAVSLVGVIGHFNNVVSHNEIT